ncbi:Hypp4048 [Branchiostoma lanceolatum]|nr:Hypp4048 [Branchiostoma lanceolatum]
MGGHTFVWQAFYDRVPSELIFERGPNNASSVETPSKFSVRCNSGLADSLCCNLTIHEVMAEDLGQPITCYGYRFDPSEPGQERSPSVYLTNGVETPRPGLSAKMIGLVVAAAVCVVVIAGVAVYKMRKGCSAPDVCICTTQYITSTNRSYCSRWMIMTQKKTCCN